MDINDRLALKVKEACAVSGLGQTTLYEAMQSGALPYIKVGASRLIMRVDLEDFLKSHRVERAA